MPKPKKSSTPANASAATVGYEAELWQMADPLRGSMDAAEYEHVVLGLIFLKYISDAFEEQHATLEAERAQIGVAQRQRPQQRRDLRAARRIVVRHVHHRFELGEGAEPVHLVEMDADVVPQQHLAPLAHDHQRRVLRHQAQTGGFVAHRGDRVVAGAHARRFRAAVLDQLSARWFRPAQPARRETTSNPRHLAGSCATPGGAACASG